MVIRSIFYAWMLLFAISYQISFAATEEEKRQIIIEENSDYFGFDLTTQKDISLNQCKANCLSSLACKAFTYNTSARFCFLKSDFGKLNPFPGAIAGRIIIKGTEPDIGAPIELSFVPGYMQTQAVKFRDSLATNNSLAIHLGFSVLARTARENLAKGQTKAAIQYLMAMVKINPDDSTTWLELSDAALAYRSKNSSDRRVIRDTATAAALNSYLSSRTTRIRAKALARVARALQAQSRYRPALTAYKMSLELNDVPAERSAFLALRRAHGFRILNHTVDSDNRSPRICVQFSEKLKSASTEYEKFLKIDNAPPKAIDVKAKQICVEGLEHGKSYRISLRQGLPSTIGENLQSDVNLDIYIRDRKPSARFTGNNFILPYAMRRGIPLVSVNTDKADLKLYRIGERALAPLVRNSQFLKQLNKYQVEYLMGDLGEPKWNGTLTIKPELNKEVVTSIPVDEALPEFKPGIYLLTATPVVSGPGASDNRATQWFVISDIGLTTFSGNGRLAVFTRSLASAKPLAGVEVSLIARNNEVLGTSTTNALGQAEFDAGFMRGKGGLAPAIITAKNGADDFVFLDISKPGFDFSDRGVTGRPVPKGVDVYAWTERGIYRVGETVHVAALARDDQARAIKNLPLTFVFKRPDGIEDRRIIDTGAALGGYTVQLPLTQNAKRGTWQVQIFTDPKKSAVAEQRFLVEDFLPERTDFTLTPTRTSIAVGHPGTVKVAGRYLYGAPASGLTLEGEFVVRSKRDRKGFKDYVFGLASGQQTSAQRFPIKGITTLDAKGESAFSFNLKNLKATTRPQSADIVVRMREGSGRAVERRTTVDITPQNTMIGIRPLFEANQISENSIAEFNIIAVDPGDRKTVLSNANWSLVKIERHYQWYRRSSSWRYESVDLETKIADGTVDITADTTTQLSMPVEWGRYRLDVDVASSDQTATSIEFSAGWFVTSRSTETPDGLEIALDKQRYKAGDIAKLKVSPRFAGEVLIAIGTDHIVKTMSVSIPAAGDTIDIPVSDDWGAGAYILATLYRSGDLKASRMPMRSIGVKWLSVDPENRALKIALNVPEQAKPNETLTVPVALSGLKSGEEAYVTIAAVDIGILNLTAYRSPDPVKRYFGQRKLGVSMRDIYGRLIDGFLGATGRLRTGGDSADNMNSSGSPPTEKLVAFFSGPVQLDDEGKADIDFDIPQFNGTVRIMATAWTASGVGAAETETIIRDALVVTASLPKFMAPGDTSRLRVDVANTDAPSGAYDVEFESSENLILNSDQSATAVDLTSGAQTTLNIPVTAASAGNGWVKVHLTGAGGFSVSHEITMNVRPALLPVVHKLQVSLGANGGSLVVDKNLLEGRQLDGARISISVAQASAFDVPSLLLQLNQYPYGCAEQLTSKALPLLYVDDFAVNVPGLDNASVKTKIQKAINSVLSYQSYTGGFSLWGRGSDDLWLGAYVTDFLTRAIEKGYSVPTRPMKQALRNLQNMLAYQNNLEINDAAVAYALYVLARNRLASAGDLRYYTDTRLQSFKTPIAQAQLAAGMALYGDQQRAERTFRSAFRLAQQNLVTKSGTYNYGSGLRDAAAMLALASETRPKPSNTAAMQRLTSAISKADTRTNTQEQAWMLLAARGQKAANADISLVIDGLPHAGTFARSIAGAELATNPIHITNRYSEDLQATITTVAAPDQPLAAGGNGITINRSYYRLDGTQTNVSEVTQNQRFVVVINLKQLSDLPSRLIVNDLLPAGFEIENPSLVKSADLENFQWLPNSATAHLEFRDDRFMAAFNRSKGGKRNFTVAYLVRAVTPGVYRHPAAYVEDMYRPHLSAQTATGWMRVKAPQ